MRTMAKAALAAILLAVTSVHAQTGPGTGTAGTTADHGPSSPNGTPGGATSGAANARVGAVQGVTGAQKPATGTAGPSDKGTNQGASTVK